MVGPIRAAQTGVYSFFDVSGFKASFGRKRLTDIDRRPVGNSDIQVKNACLSGPIGEKKPDMGTRPPKGLPLTSNGTLDIRLLTGTKLACKAHPLSDLWVGWVRLERSPFGKRQETGI
jgi:hypothetical protein